MSRAFVFPGQGAQTIGMGRALVEAYPAARAVFDEVDSALSEKLSAVIWDGPIETLILTANAQPALMAVSLAVMRVLQAEAGLDLKRDAAFVAGHSLGEYSALAAAGTFAVSDAALLLRIRGDAMQAVSAFPPAIAGSGIRTALATVGRDPGDVLLFAPAGAVIASDAPIISAGDVVIAATQIVGSDISAGGVTVGVPVGTDGLASAVAGAADAATQASSDAAASATTASSASATPLARSALGWLEVFLEGFDAGLPSPESERKRRG